MAASIPACCCSQSPIASPNSPGCFGWRLAVEGFLTAARSVTITRDGGARHLRARRNRFLKNLLTDIEGVRVGHADDARLASGVTAIIFDSPAIASIDVRGGGPGTREDGLLKLESTVQAIDAIA